MGHLYGILAISLAFVCITPPAYSQIPQLRIQTDQFDLRLTTKVAGQVAVIDKDDNENRATDGDFDLSIRVDGKWATPSDIDVGIKVELANKRRATEEFETGEIYAYATTKMGQFEFGRQDGPADTLSFGAPVIALGQIRGDFSRYAGSQALLKPLDTRDSFKLIYMSPNLGGLRAGISWSPDFRQNSNEAEPRSRISLRNAIELGVQSEQKIGGWRLGLSGGYAFGKADPVTTRAGLNSWSIGTRARRGPLRLGAAYVRRGDSNRLERGFDQWELNGGLGWVEDNWGLAGSSAMTTAYNRSNFLIGLGGFFVLTPNLRLQSDLVQFREKRAGQITDQGFVGILELQLKI